MSASGDPRCIACQGKGGRMINGQWKRCQCVNGSAADRAWTAYVNSIGAANPAPKPPTR